MNDGKIWGKGNRGFRWNQPLAKARGPHPVDGRMTIIDTAPIEIIGSPNRRAIEEIINGLCMIVTELVEIKEIEYQRMAQVQQMIQEAKNEQAAQPVPTGTNGTKEVSKTRARTRKTKTRRTEAPNDGAARV